MDIGFFFEYKGRVVQLPVNPEKIKVTYKGKNKTAEIIKLGEVNILKDRGLASISFESFLPEESWFPAIRTTGAFEKPLFYKTFFQKIMEEKTYVRFIVTGLDINILVSIESFEFYHQAGDHEDAYFSLSLLEYRLFKITEIILPAPTAETDDLPEITTDNTVVEIPAVSAVPDIPVTQIVIGSSVLLNGRVHYDSYGSKPGKTFKDYTGKVSHINTKGSHPYHITTLTGGYLGWVTAESVKLL